MPKPRRNKGGRIRKSGERFPCGKLRPAIDHGNDRVVALTSIFRQFQGGKADLWVNESAIGRAWAVGLLDGFDADPAALRDAGLNYALRYWAYWPSVSGTSNYEGQDRGGKGGGDFSTPDPGGKTFEHLDAAVTAAGRGSRNMLHELCVDLHHFPQQNPPWLDRLINERLVRQGRPVAGQLPIASDFDRLKLAIEGLLTIVAGKRREAA
jgi:hypothetical protein